MSPVAGNHGRPTRRSEYSASPIGEVLTANWQKTDKYDGPIIREFQKFRSRIETTNRSEPSFRVRNEACSIFLFEPCWIPRLWYEVSRRADSRHFSKTNYDCIEIQILNIDRANCLIREWIAIGYDIKTYLLQNQSTSVWIFAYRMPRTHIRVAYFKRPPWSWCSDTDRLGHKPPASPLRADQRRIPALSLINSRLRWICARESITQKAE